MTSGGSVAGLGLSAAATWGAADFAGGLATKKAAPPFVVAVAHGFSLVLLYAAAFSLHAAGSGYNLYGFLSGIFCGAGLIALYAALSRGSMGLSAALSGVITAISPVVFSWFNEGHATPPRRLVGFAVAAVAIWMVAYTPGQNSASGARPRGLGLAVIAGLCFGGMLIFMHLAAADGILGPLISMRITSTSVGVVAGIWYWLAHRNAGPASSGFPTGKVFVLALVAGTLDTSGNLLYLFASQAGRLDVSAVLASLYPAGTMLLAAWLLRERATRSQIAGMVLALAAVALIAA
jgi:drug/metabolite transporter (DMT)-like permease